MVKQRSNEKELIDLGEDFYTPEEYEQCQKILFRINKTFGTFSDTLRLLKQFSAKTLLDVGCGSGLFIIHLSRFFPHMQFYGTDISPAAICLAEQELIKWQQTHPAAAIKFNLQATPELALAPNEVDIILSTLVCHHLTNEEIVIFLKNAYQACRKAIIINDLQRHALASWFFSWLSPIFFRNRLVMNDGLISIRKSFTRQEWKILLEKAHIPHYQITWRFPFRWRITIWKK